MIDRLPAPLIDVDTDVSFYKYVEFPKNLLSNPELSELNDEQHRAALTLIFASWTQVPAGSLPNSDGTLAVLAGYRRDLAGWAEIRSAVLAGWTLCNDNRFYFPPIIASVEAAFGRQRKRNAADTQRQSRARIKSTLLEIGCDASLLTVENLDEALIEMRVRGAGKMRGEKRRETLKNIAGDLGLLPRFEAEIIDGRNVFGGSE